MKNQRILANLQTNSCIIKAYPNEKEDNDLVRGRIGEIQTNLANSYALEAQDFVLLLRNIGVEMGELTLEDRKPYLEDMRKAFKDCPTQWNDTFDSIYESLVFKGQSAKWQIVRRHHRIKWAIVMEKIFPYLDPNGTEQVHWRISWVKVFGDRLGMENPAGIDGEKVLLENSRGGGWLANAFLTEVMNFAAHGREARLRQFEAEWEHLFMERYTPRLLVDYWMVLFNGDKKIGEKINGADVSDNKLRTEILKAIQGAACQDEPTKSNEDAAYDLGYLEFDDEYQITITEKGVIRLLQEIGVFEKSTTLG
jgi:hypothetical protein